MDTLTYWNGTWHEGNPAILGPRDHAFWLGSMVFDGGRAFEGCGPDLDLHAERVVRSARAIGLNPSQTPEEILKLMHESVRRFGPKAELYVRPMFWAGKGGAGPISVDPDSAQFLLCTYVAPMRAGTPLTLGLFGAASWGGVFVNLVLVPLSELPLMLGMLFRHVPWLCGHAWIELPDMSGDAFVVKINLNQFVTGMQNIRDVIPFPRTPGSAPC